MLHKTRMTCQQLAAPAFTKPGELVAWMGAMQAQAYDMAKWAVGLRLKNGTLAAVNEALNTGEILRTHVMRPTWHLVAAEDIRWMIRLSAARISAANDSYGKSRNLDISPALYNRVNDLLGRMLEGGNSLTKTEIASRLEQAGIGTENAETTRFLLHAETDGLVCSGPDRGGKPTYALLDERVPKAPEPHREEALATLALRYFQSHSPATLADFVWWSGLSLREARQAVGLAGDKLIRETYAGTEWIVHENCRTRPGNRSTAGETHLLPPFDEYLISYKDRTHVLAAEHQPKAFNNWGIFYPVILHRGRIVGNWTKTAGRKTVGIGTDLFPGQPQPDEKTLGQAAERYRRFLTGK